MTRYEAAAIEVAEAWYQTTPISFQKFHFYFSSKINMGDVDAMEKRVAAV